MLVARDGLTLGELPAGARVGTGSPRRAAQLRALGPRPRRSCPIRGNVDTRLAQGRRRRARRGRAGPRRAGPARPLDEVTEVLDPLQMLPAPGRARSRSSAAPTTPTSSSSLRCSTTPTTRAAVTAERALLAALEAGCTAPVGALAEVGRGRRRPRALPAGPSSAIARRHGEHPPVRHRPVDGGRSGSVATSPAELLDDGAGALVGALTGRWNRRPSGDHQKSDPPWAASPSSAPAPATPAC